MKLEEPVQLNEMLVGEIVISENESLSVEGLNMMDWLLLRLDHAY